MRKLKSAIILKDRIFMPDYDNYSKMLKELGITDDYINASKVFVRAELSPKNGDVFSDIDGWKFSVDQDITPEWFDEKDCTERMRKAVKEWAKTHIFIGQNDLKISHGENIFIKDCKNVDICGNSSIEGIYGNTTVVCICDNVTVEDICDNVTVEDLCDNVTVEYVFDDATINYIFGNAAVANIGSDARINNICDHATITNIYGDAIVNSVFGNATIKRIYDNATAIGSPYNKWNKAESLVISDKAIFKDCYSKTIYHADGWKFVEVKK